MSSHGGHKPKLFQQWPRFFFYLDCYKDLVELEQPSVNSNQDKLWPIYTINTAEEFKHSYGFKPLLPFPINTSPVDTIYTYNRYQLKLCLFKKTNYWSWKGACTRIQSTVCKQLPLLGFRPCLSQNISFTLSCNNRLIPDFPPYNKAMSENV